MILLPAPADAASMPLRFIRLYITPLRYVITPFHLIKYTLYRLCALRARYEMSPPLRRVL